MAPHIISMKELEQCAREAIESGLTVNDCPEKYCHFNDEWQEQYKALAFDRAYGMAE